MIENLSSKTPFSYDAAVAIVLGLQNTPKEVVKLSPNLFREIKEELSIDAELLRKLELSLKPYGGKGKLAEVLEEIKRERHIDTSDIN